MHPQAFTLFLSILFCKNADNGSAQISKVIDGTNCIVVAFFPAPRSGLAWKHSIDVGAGVIDADYRGPVGVILFNHSDQDFAVKAGDRVAQLILERIVTPDVMEVEDLESTTRGSGGFGSTGIGVLSSS